MATKRITQVTLRRIFDTINLSKVLLEGRLEEPDFLARIHDLDSMSSTASRYKSAAGDIWQHRVNNPQDWPDDSVGTDSRFGLQHGDDEFALRFLAEMLHPVVRPDEEEVAGLLKSFNEALARDGCELYAADWISGHAVYGWRRRDSFLDLRPNGLVGRVVTGVDDNGEIVTEEFEHSSGEVITEGTTFTDGYGENPTQRAQFIVSVIRIHLARQTCRHHRADVAALRDVLGEQVRWCPSCGAHLGPGAAT
ncbi:hypothetical protein MSIM_24880 [Mycobacterium simiae]|uniref:AbiJ-related protein n=1 Tax=Mycobacterium simiae TaxID=1784 RepID=UPI000407BC41|nr:hypothetical protein [Mycobacterium simiae]BBX41037.1 hypothetical protein MSIM_24880 [Mycobacterium simiae]